MSRWEPDARGRLERAALGLYRERGFERTAVSEIAARAGLTERTFFRHFADKREVLFGGQDVLHETLTAAVAGAPAGLAPIDVVAAALDAVAAILADRRDLARQRQEVIDANAGLQEREQAKLASLAETTAEALRRRGVAEPAASLAAEAGMAVFKVAFGRWLTASDDDDLGRHLQEALDQLRAVTAGA